MRLSRFSERCGTHLCALLAFVLSSSLAFAQFESASVLGYVRDNSGATIPHAAVTLTNVQTGIVQTATTDDSGRFEFSSVLIGRYRVASEATGFAKTETEPFQLTVNARQRVDVDLKNGSVNEAVTVSSAPTLLETETSSRGGVIAAAQIENLPLNGRSYADLALLMPSTNTLIQAKDGSIYNRALVNMPLNNLAPRFGLAYSPDTRTAIRAGYGISYTRSTGRAERTCWHTTARISWARRSTRSRARDSARRIRRIRPRASGRHSRDIPRPWYRLPRSIR